MQTGWERRRSMEAAFARMALKTAPKRHLGKRARTLRRFREAAERAEEPDLLLLADAATSEDDDLRWAAIEALKQACANAARRRQGAGPDVPRQ